MAILKWLWCLLAGHRYYIEDLQWAHLGHDRRVCCECVRCGWTHYAHCGLALPGRFIGYGREPS